MCDSYLRIIGVRLYLLENISPEFTENQGLTLLQRRSLSYRNQFIDLQSKSMDWLQYDRDFRHERVNHISFIY